MNLKRLLVPWGIVAAVIVIGGTAAWLVSSHYIVPNLVDRSAKVDGRTQESGPTGNSVVEATVENAQMSESLNSGESENSLPSGDDQVSATQDGDGTAGVVAQRDAATLDEARETTGDNLKINANSNELNSLNPDNPGRTPPVVEDSQAALPGAGPTPTPAPQDVLQATAGPAAIDLLAFAPTPETPVEESGEAPVHLEDTGEALSPAPQDEGKTGNDQVTVNLEKKKLKYPNLSSQLNQLVAGVEAGKTTAEEAAGGSPVHQEESVAVTIHLSAHVDEVVAYLEDNGGDPRNVGEDYIEAYVPVPLLGPVSERPGVLRVREIIPPQAAQAGAASRP